MGTWCDDTCQIVDMRTAYECRAYPTPEQANANAYPAETKRTGDLLRYKANRRGGEIVMVVDRWFPSTRTCSARRHRMPALASRVRAWTCPTCRTRHDRDVDAAKDIPAAGLATSACGRDVRHVGTRVKSLVKQEDQPVRAGTSRA
jgi:hypothetical protein